MAGFYSANVADGIKEAIAKEKKDMKVFNVMLLGKTGVGKSTLINNLFSERIAQTGIGKPVTQDIRLYKKEGFPLQVYDTPGFELGGDNALGKLLDEIGDEIRRGYKSFDIEQSIHCI
ncbi:MAG: 50S ribosome-binding GTPase, partial [Lachnospiraceae bacterium]|nr:50S ribosome-binding GTPase [Lachnospiraceae bacterium]